jgi:bifunctional UDP-N-acetylglucosamine pyrophosphorylase / glucosamine-1-phosphate N-acetyltransferase
MTPASLPSETFSFAASPATDATPRPGDAHAFVGIVMAAGDAVAMRSARPKPLHRICGRTLAGHALDTLSKSGVDRAVVVVSSGIDRVSKALQQEAPIDMTISVVTQSQPLGSADAIAVAVTALDDDFDVLPSAGARHALGSSTRGEVTDLVVLPSDRPLISARTIQALIEAHQGSSHIATLLTASLTDPDGHGVIVRGRGGRVETVVDPAVASMHHDWDQTTEHECDTGVMVIHLDLLAPALRRVTRDGSGGSLAEVVSVLVDAGYSIGTCRVEHSTEAMGVDDRVHLAEVEAELRRRTNAALMASGVTMIDPLRTYVDATVTIAPDVTLFPGTMLQGSTKVGAGAEIGPDCRLVDTIVDEGASVENTVARSSHIGAGAVVGPFAVLEPGSKIGPGVRTGPSFTS